MRKKLDKFQFTIFPSSLIIANKKFVEYKRAEMMLMSELTFLNIKLQSRCTFWQQ